MLTTEQLNQATLEGRHVRIRAASEVLSALFTAGREHRFRVAAGLPEDAVLASLEVLSMGPGGADIDFIYVHPSFDPRAEGAEIPVRPVVLESLTA